MSQKYPEEDPYFVEAEDEEEMFGTRGDGERSRRSRAVPDFVRRAIENTVGSVQNTGTVSKEALQYILHQGDRTKREVVRIVASEVGDFLQHVDISREIIKVLTSVQAEVSLSVRFKPTKGGGIIPDVEAKGAKAVVAEDDESEPEES